MAIGRISGALLFSDLDRQSVDLAFTTNGKPLTYMDFTNFRFGVNTNSLVDTFTVNGTANVSGITRVFGNLVAASGVEAYDVTTGAFNVVGGAGVSGNLYAGNIFATNFSGNISNTGGTSTFANLEVTGAAVLGSMSTANAVISGGYISALANATITTGNLSSLYATNLNSTEANLTTLNAQNFSTGNAVISGGYISNLANAYITTADIVNFSTGNAVISGGYITALANATITTGNVISWYAETINATNGNITTLNTSTTTTANLNSTTGNITTLDTNTTTTAVLNVTTANITTGNAGIWYATFLNSSDANITTLTAGTTTAAILNATNGNITTLDAGTTTSVNLNATTGNITTLDAGTTTSANLNATSANLSTIVAGNLSTANAVITGGYINNLANLSATYGVITNFSTGNTLITGGNISGLTSANISTANINIANLGNIKIEDITISSLTGNLVLSPLLSNGNAVVVINGTSALQLPSGTSAQQPVAYAGAIRWNNTTNSIEVYNGSTWISLLSQINNQTISPDGLSISYTLDYASTPEGIIVSINGTLQAPGTAYTVAGTTITFAEIPLVTDIISVRYLAAGTTTAENAQEINAGNIALSTGAVLVDSFSKDVYRSAKYLASTTADSGAAEFAEFAVTQFDTTVAVSNVNKAVTGSTLTTITANISGSLVRVYATATSSSKIRLQKTYFII